MCLKRLDEEGHGRCAKVNGVPCQGACHAGGPDRINDMRRLLACWMTSKLLLETNDALGSSSAAGIADRPTADDQACGEEGAGAEPQRHAVAYANGP